MNVEEEQARLKDEKWKQGRARDCCRLAEMSIRRKMMQRRF